MLAAWNQVALAAGLASLLALGIILLVRSIRWQTFTLPQVIGLSVCTGLGLTLWFLIFNIFSLGWLDFDFPIPIFPVSPEDLSCMVVTGLTAFIYWFITNSFPPARRALATEIRTGGRRINNPVPLEWWVCLLPALAALIIDVYFI